MLRISFLTIPDPEGHGPALLLTGDWLFVKLSDGKLTGLGEASHSGDDAGCIRRMTQLFQAHLTNVSPDLDSIAALEAGPFARAGDFVTATAISALDQALYDLVARSRSVPVWRLFAQVPGRTTLPLYATINRCLTTRTLQDYRRMVGLARDRGFRIYKCAPFDHVTPDGDQLAQAREGLLTLRAMRREFGELGMRIDFHQRFTRESFMRLLPEIEALAPDWIEEPFPISEGYRELRRRTSLKLAAGELFFGVEGFRPLIEGGWADVVMPDVKHVGGFGPMLRVCRLAAEHGVEVSPHNPSGPVSTMASAHLAALFPNVTSLEVPLDGDGTRARYAEGLGDGGIAVPPAGPDRVGTGEGPTRPGWGIEAEALERFALGRE